MTTPTASSVITQLAQLTITAQENHEEGSAVQVAQNTIQQIPEAYLAGLNHRDLGAGVIVAQNRTRPPLTLAEMQRLRDSGVARRLFTE